MKVRHKLIERVGDWKGRIECPAGHRRVIVLIPETERRKARIGETGIKMIASWWQKNGVTVECPRCEREAKQVKAA